MKIKNISLSHYKKFRTNKVFDFCDEQGEVNDITLLVGENGSGKSSVLQAIAMLVGAVAKPHFKSSELEYPGFNYELIQTGRMPIEVRASVQFSEDELVATREYSNRLAEEYPDRNYFEVGNFPEIEIRLDYDNEKVIAPRGIHAYFQTKGYQYALQLARFVPDFNQLLSRVGSIYWYHEQRTASSILAPQNGGEGVPQKVDESQLRKLMVSWSHFNNHWNSEEFEPRENQRNIYQELEEKYRQIFPMRRFQGSSPKMMPDQLLEEEDFWLSKNGMDYELSEMSGGERAIFPILIDFANWNIDNSIILIDEIELHLHPPLQQALIRALPTLGNNNQFIITTHSDDVATMIPETQIIRL